VQAGASLRQLSKDAQDAAVVVKFHRGLTVLRGLTTPDRSTKPTVYWLSGPTGTGKTRACFSFAQHSGLNYEDVWMSSGTLQWFDGYDGQQLAIFDDFRAKHVEFAFLLRLLDRYPIRVPFKGGFVNWNPKYIFITSPYPIDRAFEKRSEHIPEDIQQLKRRISKIFNLDQGALLPAFRISDETLHNRIVSKMLTKAGLPDPFTPEEEDAGGSPAISSFADSIDEQ